jgi:uncharacterized damage-inducible protein DinB
VNEDEAAAEQAGSASPGTGLPHPRSDEASADGARAGSGTEARAAAGEALDQEMIRRARGYFSEIYLPKIRAAVDRLPAEDLWWRPNAASNSVGNLLLHLAGNVRQWVVAGLAGREDVRNRAAEFAADGGMEASELLERLESALAEVDEALAGLDPAALGEPRRVQGIETTGLGALLHAVEHFSGHTGQILWVTKLRTGGELGFYSESDDGTITTHW